MGGLCRKPRDLLLFSSDNSVETHQGQRQGKQQCVEGTGGLLLTLGLRAGLGAGRQGRSSRRTGKLGAEEVSHPVSCPDSPDPMGCWLAGYSARCGPDSFLQAALALSMGGTESP